MSLINFIILIFGLFFSKELIAANEERVIVSSLVLVLILGLEFLSETVREELNNSISVIYDEIKNYMIIYYSIIKAFETLCIQRNNFLSLIFQGLITALNHYKRVVFNWEIFAQRYFLILEYNLLKHKLIKI